MAAHPATRGKQALGTSDYETAIKEYTAAIKESPTSPDFYIQRSVAYQRAKKPAEALADAEQGVLNAQKRAKKEAIIEAQFRRGVALYGLKRYGDADFILRRVKQMDGKHKSVDMWINKIVLELKSVPADDERRKCTITETPSGSASGADPAPQPESSSNSKPTSAPAPAPQQTPADKIRYEWYQNTENVYFTLLAKGVPKEKASIKLQERALNISFPLINGSDYELSLEPLFASVQPEKSITRVMPSKVEVIMSKATAGQKWPTLEGTEPIPSNTSDENEAIVHNAMTSALFSAAGSIGPAYPTSSKSGPKDWDKIAREERKKAAPQTKDGEEDKDKAGTAKDDDSDDEGGDESNKFFKMLYKNASPDMQRAMMKSYTESGGTSLSTNWDEVKKGKVEVCPPDGMEAKKWES
ncbi:hypothetical protein CLAFUW4_06888 [Fulvia fulva]|nr:hypothetical protein CLAFUR4_06896 [Fulvia fulva]WPV16391.1 hypothetical protein CLAFUW4_06888 [Fulvia fulva]WPV31643.1 hypothetical protein CLAFUW7_06887 [Fulvia fulva]